MRLNFKEFRIPSGISKQSYRTVDAREQIADLLYTRANGIKAHRLAFKILDSTGEEEYIQEEVSMIRMGVEQCCLPCVIDGLMEMLESGSNTDKIE